MRKQKIALTITLFTILGILSSCTNNIAYKLEDGYIYVQNKERRGNENKWTLVWEENFNNQKLDTNTWSRIGLFETDKWKVPVENGKK